LLDLLYRHVHLAVSLCQMLLLVLLQSRRPLQAGVTTQQQQQL
jgi:hypothetical protein